MYPGPTEHPYGKSLYKPYITWVFIGDNPQESQCWTLHKYHGSTRTLGIHPSLSLESWFRGVQLFLNIFTVEMIQLVVVSIVFFGCHPTKTWAMETNPGCLVYIGDYTTQLYGDYNKPL